MEVTKTKLHAVRCEICGHFSVYDRSHPIIYVGRFDETTLEKKYPTAKVIDDHPIRFCIDHIATEEADRAIERYNEEETRRKPEKNTILCRR